MAGSTENARCAVRATPDGAWDAHGSGPHARTAQRPPGGPWVEGPSGQIFSSNSDCEWRGSHTVRQTAGLGGLGALPASLYQRFPVRSTQHHPRRTVGRSRLWVQSVSPPPITSSITTQKLRAKEKAAQASLAASAKSASLPVLSGQPGVSLRRASRRCQERFSARRVVHICR